MNHFLKKILITLAIAINYAPVFAEEITVDCPDDYLDYFHLGYDLVKGNPANYGTDPGWRTKIFNETLPEPACLHCMLSDGCKGGYISHDMESEIDYYQRLMEKVNVSETSDDFLSSYSFTGSAEYTYQQQDIFGLGLINVQAEAVCQVATASRTPYCYDFVFSSGFSKAIAEFPTSTDTPNWYDQVHDFFVIYGTHVVETASLGARWSYESLFTQISYEAMRALDINIDAAAEISAEFYRTKGASAAGEHEEETEMRVLFDTSAYEQSAIVIGSTPPQGLNFGEWANNIDNPIPEEFELKAISDFLTANFFPNDPEIAKKREVMQAGYLAYCASVPNCHLPQSAEVKHVRVTEEGLYTTKNWLEATCPDNYSLIAGGCQSEPAEEPYNWILASIKPVLTHNTFFCMTNIDYPSSSLSLLKGLSVTASCMRNDLVKDRNLKNCTGLTGRLVSECTAYCDPGFVVTGGGCESNDIDLSQPWKVTHSAPVYNNNGTQSGWHCRIAQDAGSNVINQTALGNAVCTQFTQAASDQKIITELSGTAGWETNGSIVQCEEGYTLLSGGCSVPIHADHEFDEWKVIQSHPANSNAWSCLAQYDLNSNGYYRQDVQTSALCVKFDEDEI